MTTPYQIKASDSDSQRAKKLDEMFNELYERTTLKYDDFIHKFGQNPDVDSGSVPEAVWALGGTITWPTSAVAASIVSDSANDDGSPVGTGARTLFVQGVDAAFAKITETITMNGVGAVTTANSYLFIDRMYVATVGSVESNDGNITATIGGDTVAYILAGDGQTLQAAMVVPAVANKTPHILHIWAGIGKATGAYARLQLCRQPDGGSRRVNDDVIISSDGSDLDLHLATAAPIGAGDRLWWEVIESSANNIQVFAGYEIAWLDD